MYPKQPESLFSLLNWATKKNQALLSIKSWLVNRDPYKGLL